MSLYEYILPVDPADAETYVKGVSIMRHSSGLLSGCCSYTPSYRPCEGHILMQSVGKKYSLYSDDGIALCVGRPFTGEGIDTFYDTIKTVLDYGNFILMDEEMGSLLLNAAVTDEEKAWVRAVAGKTIIFVNDNEF